MNTWMTWSAWRPGGRLFVLAVVMIAVLCGAGAQAQPPLAASDKVFYGRLFMSGVASGVATSGKKKPVVEIKLRLAKREGDGKAGTDIRIKVSPSKGDSPDVTAKALQKALSKKGVMLMKSIKANGDVFLRIYPADQTGRLIEGLKASSTDSGQSISVLN